MEELQSRATCKPAGRSDEFGSYGVQRCASNLRRAAVHVALALLANVAVAQDVQRPLAQPTLTIADPSESQSPPVQITSEVFRQRLVARIDAPKPGAVLRIESAPLLGPDGVAAELAVAALGRGGKSIEVAPPGTGAAAVIDIDLSAKLTRIGEYAGYITLRYGDEKPTVKMIRVDRTLIDLPIEALGVERVPNRKCITCWRRATVWLTLQAPPDRDLTITPTLIELALNRTGKEKVQAIVGGQAISAAGADAANGIALKSGETRRMAVDLSGLGEVGEYAGKVRFASAGFKPKDQVFTVLVKDAWWFAVVPIVLGACASMWLRRYGSDRRPRLIVRQRIAKLGEGIDALRGAAGKLDETENRVLDAFNRRLIALYVEATNPAALPDDWSATAQTSLHRIAAKLPSYTLWANARRLTAALDPSVDVTAIETSLCDIQNALELDADLTVAQLAELAQLPESIARLRRNAVLATLDALQSELDELRKIALPAQLVAPAWAEANAKLTQARDHARADEFEAVRPVYEEARKIYATLLLDDLATRVDAGTPVGLDARQWTELKPQIDRHLQQARAERDAKGALAGYAQAYGLYLNGQIAALLPLLLDEARMNSIAQKLAADKQQDFLNLGKGTAGKLREAAVLLTSRQLRAAAAKHLEALSGWQQLLSQLPSGVKMGGVEAGAPGTAEVAPGAGLPPGAGEATALLPTVFGRVEESAAGLSQRTKIMDGVVDVLAIALSAVLGVQFVWGPNPTWGGLSDWLSALLWGLGLHQVSGFTFDGVLGLREKLLK